MKSQENGGLLLRKANELKKRVTDLFFVFLFLLYPMLWMGEQLFGMSISIILLFFVVIEVMFVHIQLVKKGYLEANGRRDISTILGLAIVVVGIARIVEKMFQDSNLGEINIESQVLVILLVCIYLLMSQGLKIYSYYWDFILYSGLLFMMFYYLDFFGVYNISTIFGMGNVQILSFVLLLCAISSFQYCICKDKILSLFYLSVSVIGFFVLFLEGKVIGIILMGYVFLMIPIVIKPGVEYIKRCLRLCFIYAFLLSSMPIIIEFLHLTYLAPHYDLKMMIYIDLFIGILGVLLFSYWEKNSSMEGIDIKVWTFAKQISKVAIVTLSILLFLMANASESWKNISEHGLVEIFTLFGGVLSKELLQSPNLLFTIIEEQGFILGIICFAWFFILYWKNREIMKGNSVVDDNHGISILVANLFGIQILLWSPDFRVIPIYLVFILIAIFYPEKGMNEIKLLYKGANYEKEK